MKRLQEINDTEATDASLADLGRALGRHAELLRIGAHYERALNARDEAAEIWRVLERDRAGVLAQLKGAQEAHLAASPDAWERFERVAIEVAKPRYGLYADFYHEFRALALCREGRFVEALDDLEIALELRIEQGRKTRQLGETRELISRVEEHARRQR